MGVHLFASCQQGLRECNSKGGLCRIDAFYEVTIANSYRSPETFPAHVRARARESMVPLGGLVAFHHHAPALSMTTMPLRDHDQNIRRFQHSVKFPRLLQPVKE